MYSTRGSCFFPGIAGSLEFGRVSNSRVNAVNFKLTSIESVDVLNKFRFPASECHGCDDILFDCLNSSRNVLVKKLKNSQKSQEFIYF